MYDELLNLTLPDSCFLNGFADDVALVATGRSTEILELAVNDSMRRIQEWLNLSGLKLAVHKTEAVLITERRVFRTPILILGKDRIPLKRSGKYLGVQLDSRLKFNDHVKLMVEKSMATAKNLSKLMPNIGGPRECRRRLLNSAVHSQLLYGAEIWAKTMDTLDLRRKMKGVQRRSAL
ncbi:MAG: hypothetical protein KTM48_01705, partial [Wolbachia endosymbiont of Pissodes strobi]|nr:hypothetical protein [Wolbachia endosymbiont of Pissodes strobi]